MSEQFIITLNFKEVTKVNRKLVVGSIFRVSFTNEEEKFRIKQMENS